MPALSQAMAKANRESTEAGFTQLLSEMIEERSGVAPATVGATNLGPLTLVWATFGTIDGAAQALNGLAAAGKSGLIGVENTAVIQKDAAGNVEFSESEDLSGWQGLGNGLLLGGLLGALLPGLSAGAAAAKMGAALGLGGRISDAGFEDDQLRQAAAKMPPNSSALVALVNTEKAQELAQLLTPRASNVGSTAIPASVAAMAGS
jgi:uncharacterized membrane protein